MSKKSNEELILEFITETCKRQKNKGHEIGCTTNYIAEKLKMQRANVSSVLNKLYREEKIVKTKGKPVIYLVEAEAEKEDKRGINGSSGLDFLIGNSESLLKPIQQAKAAILYPPKGLHTLLLGATGVGKTMFAELMYKFAIDNEVLRENSPFVSFNCADYSNNPQLLLAQLFGAKKGSYTGANEDKEGLVQKANKGILFLDEVHRLPPEGQEMFFYLMDKGQYKPLGETGEYNKADIIIICATTENKDSSLLSTFTRRIPMVISLPSLKDRTMKERFSLLSEFLKIEASKTSKDIKVTSEVIKNLMLYNCMGNIGQLKNDIQLVCANAFLKCVVNGSDCINVDIDELPEYIKKGIINYKLHRKELDEIISDSFMFHFTIEGSKNKREQEDSSIVTTFYDSLEERISTLKARGLTEDDINLIMSMDIEKYFKKYIYKFNENINKEELSKVVDEKVIELVEGFLNYAGKELKKVFPQKIFYGLCLHVGSSIERIRLNKFVENHKINEIIEKYPKEFSVANYLADALEKEYSILVPKDEIGFITMFITDEFVSQKENNDSVVILIAMHGNSTASSMADVVNKLIGEENTFGFDMPLEKSTKVAYEELKEYIPSINKGGGVLMLADMGSLSMFGELISQETGVKIKSIDMVTTLIALEASRKAAMGTYIDDIYNEVVHKNLFNIYYSNDYTKLDKSKENVIITMCLTGEGSAIKLKNMVEEQLYIDDKNIQVIPMSISDKEDMHIRVKRVLKEKNIIAIIGTVNPELHAIPFISASELFLDKDFAKLKSIINVRKNISENSQSIEEICDKIIENFKEDIKLYDLNAFRDILVDSLKKIEEVYSIEMDLDTLVGLSMHMVCALERILGGEKGGNFRKKESFKALYSEDIEKLKYLLRNIEDKFEIIINEDELCYIYSLIKRV
ncbi:sigma 54-interacting transcriptional regulator [Clostridium intestinale]|uniref:Sigma 54-interacting transcriptional regulator n=1 Tax=Clostridium intestinale TaxID=36845 RepID=A0A7D6VS35_9CLOT|nr:sigma-54-dependent transcriptional regulator [Clostridium intestinale]QLY80648.1 sigma 54-interacting transcriptional regulator [Clostridium intestinale]